MSNDKPTEDQIRELGAKLYEEQSRLPPEIITDDAVMTRRKQLEIAAKFNMVALTGIKLRA